MRRAYDILLLAVLLTMFVIAPAYLVYVVYFV